MSLHLILGPSGAHKVGRLLDAHQQAALAGQTAWFVVPAAADVERFQRELAGIDGPPGVARRAGAPFGAVMSVGQLERELLALFGTGETLLSREHRRAVALAAIHATSLTALAPAERSRWLDEELIRLAEELAASGDLGAGAEDGLRSWAAHTSDARGHELADLLEADAAVLKRLAAGHAGPRHVDRARGAGIVARALRQDPSAAADLHVVFAGFDDLEPVQRTLVVALARSAARVLVSLPFQEGREALAAARPLVDELRAVADDPEVLPVEAGRGEPTLERLADGLYEHGVYVVPAAAPDPDPFAPLEFEAQALGPLVAYDDVDPAVDPASAALPAPHFEPSEAPTSAIAPPEAEASVWDTLQAPVLELCGGGPDEEAALIAEHVAAKIAAGCSPERIAVVVGPADARGPALLAALRRAGVPAHLVAERHAKVWPSVAAIVALLRALAPGGEARHLVGWIAGPGGPGTHDAFDASVRRSGATSLRDAFHLWARLGGERLIEVDAINAAVRRSKRDRFVPELDASTDAETANTAGDQPLEAVVAGLLRTRLSAALSRIDGRLTPDQERDVRAVGGILSMLDGLVELGRDAPDLGLGLEELATLIERARAPRDVEPPGSVAVLGALDVRTRYPEVVVVARATRGAYPANEQIRQLLTRADRAALSGGYGWPTPAKPEHAASERYLAYEVVARPTRQLVVAWHRGNGDGKPVEPSPLLDEIRRLHPGEELPRVDLPAGAAARRAVPAQRRERLGAARRAPRHREPVPEVAPLLAAQPRDRYAVGELQTASRCAAQWFVGHHLRPEPLTPDAAPLTSGRLRHEVLSEIVGAVVTGGQPLGPAAIPSLRQALAESAERLAQEGRRQQETQAERLMRERVVAEVDATIPGLCGDARLAHQPEAFELPFGTTPRPSAGAREAASDDEEDAGDEARPPVAIARGGHQLVLSGRIDRLDRGPGGELVVVDYKGANVDPFKGATWVEGRELQAGLYALAAEQLAGEGTHAVASLYQPVPGPANQPPRGATSVELPGRSGLLRNDRLEPHEWDALLDELVRLAAEAQRSIDDGIVAPQPTSCSGRGCRYPWLCREVQG
ncbi:MAG: PD-(D/E)XK nuclease family protein [Solirubrobacteraceae bacterium]|nr:PD-(D/E)XK nuclease family protein [Solirubrobacteraceae bacterium]